MIMIKVLAIEGKLTLVDGSKGSAPVCDRCVARDTKMCRQPHKLYCSRYTSNGYYLHTTPGLIAQFARQKVLGDD